MRMRSITRHLLLVFAIELSGIFLILLAAGYKGGLFNSVELLHTTRGPYEIVYLSGSQFAGHLDEQIAQLSLMLQTKNVPPLSVCTIWYDVAPEAKLSNRGGFLVQDKIALPAPYAIGTVAPREVIVARVKAHPDLAPLKTYPKMRAWMKQNHFQIAGPALEIYGEDGTIECEVPIQPIGNAAGAP
jgi:hypothetical protein